MKYSTMGKGNWNAKMYPDRTSWRNKGPRERNAWTSGVRDWRGERKAVLNILRDEESKRRILDSAKCTCEELAITIEERGQL